MARHQVATTYVNQLRLNPTALVGCPATPGMEGAPGRWVDGVGHPTGEDDALPAD